MEAQFSTQNSQSLIADTQGSKTTSKHIVFIGGIPLQATRDDLIKYVSRFSVAEHISLPIDYNTGAHKGFAKAFFKTEAGVNSLLKFKRHSMFGVEIGISRWVQKSKHQSKREVPSENKVFFRFKYQLSESELLNFFSMFGPVKSIEIKSDYLTGQLRDFGFVIFESASSAKLLIEKGPSFQLNSAKLFVQESRSNKQLAKESKFKQTLNVNQLDKTSSVQVGALASEVNNQNSFQFNERDDIVSTSVKVPKMPTLSGYETATGSPKSNQLRRPLKSENALISSLTGTIVPDSALKKQSEVQAHIIGISREGWVELNHQSSKNLLFSFQKNSGRRSFRPYHPDSQHRHYALF